MFVSQKRQFEAQYVSLVEHILQSADLRPTRNAPTFSTFGAVISFDVSKSFPILQGRKMFPKGVFGELEAMLRGPEHIADFEIAGCNYWNQWAKDDGSIDIDYGNVWLDFNGVNQLKDVIYKLQTEPFGRRHIITGWKPDHLGKTDLPCCHMLYQFYATNDGKLEMIWYQRSVDVMVGLPSDAIFAAAWLIAMARASNLTVGQCHMVFGDTHIYQAHANDALEYTMQYYELLSECQNVIKSVGWSYNPSGHPTWDNLFNAADFTLIGYNPKPAIKFEVFA